eukprot:1141597-Pelagomonas_calceolata.AAC.1
MKCRPELATGFRKGSSSTKGAQPSKKTLCVLCKSTGVVNIVGPQITLLVSAHPKQGPQL